LPENHGCPNLFLPDHWSRYVKSALLPVISLARFACVHTLEWAAGYPPTAAGVLDFRGEFRRACVIAPPL